MYVCCRYFFNAFFESFNWILSCLSDSCRRAFPPIVLFMVNENEKKCWAQGDPNFPENLWLGKTASSSAGEECLRLLDLNQPVRSSFRERQENQENYDNGFFVRNDLWVYVKCVHAYFIFFRTGAFCNLLGHILFQDDCMMTAARQLNSTFANSTTCVCRAWVKLVRATI